MRTAIYFVTCDCCGEKIDDTAAVRTSINHPRYGNLTLDLCRTHYEEWTRQIERIALFMVRKLDHDYAERERAADSRAASAAGYEQNFRSTNPAGQP